MPCRLRLLLSLLLPMAAACGRNGASTQQPQCDTDNGGITLPAEFCAATFADELGVARHVAVGPDGTVYVALEDRTRTSTGTSRRREAGGIVVLRDTDRDGRADLMRRIPTGGGTGIALRGDWLYYTTVTTVERVRLTPDRLGAAAAPDTLVLGIPPEGHISRSLAFDDSGGMFVHVGSDSNVCTSRHTPQSLDPCPELPLRAGIWRYGADRLRQRHPDAGVRWATGLRNAVGLAWDSATRALYAVSHGRDGLATLWPQLYTAAQSAERCSRDSEPRRERG